ncbi:substrate-binding domain-containing protein [Kaistia sp. 32K]|uniref:substrate-binding domain-containing protein n=1 Tax=Kaistia sp. 32K TaxID=2795690 RepID=UPI0019157E86|nr:substrate-binding domain-containing protein [Kaistia sp. 32K]
MVSIKALAQHLNISIGTVSRALNGRADVNPETRKRVLAAAEALGYVPNQSGRSLRQGTTNVIGFTIETNIETTSQGDTFFMTVFDGVQTVFARHKLDLVVLPCSSEDDPYDHVRRVVSRQFVDGLLISATQRIDPRIDFLIERGIPFVTLGRSESGGDHSWIDVDFEGVAAGAVARLVARGHRRIALANTARGINLSYIFEDAYRRALTDHGIAYDPDIAIRGEITERGGYEICDRLLSLPDCPTAVVLVNENLAIGFYRRLHDAGLMPGRDMAIIGLRQSPQARFLSPTLTCHRLSLHDVGVELAQSLLAMMPAYKDQYPQGMVQKIWPMELVPGESDPPLGAG